MESFVNPSRVVDDEKLSRQIGSCPNGLAYSSPQESKWHQQEAPSCSKLAFLVMLRIASAALTTPVLPIKASRRAVTAVPPQRQVSQVLLTAATLSILGSSRFMSAAATSPAGECANPQGPVPENIQSLASEVLKVWLTNEMRCKDF